MHVESPKKRTTEQQLIDLQQETLAAVNHLTAVQEKILACRVAADEGNCCNEESEIDCKGWFHDESGNWIGVVANSGEE